MGHEYVIPPNSLIKITKPKLIVFQHLTVSKMFHILFFNIVFIKCLGVKGRLTKYHHLLILSW